MKQTFNLKSLLEEKGSIKATIHHQGFYDKLHCYFDPGSLDVELIPNNLKGGYIGNTLLVPLEKAGQLPSHVFIAAKDLLFLGAVIIVEIDKIKYTLKKRHNFLKINIL